MEKATDSGGGSLMLKQNQTMYLRYIIGLLSDCFWGVLLQFDDTNDLAG
jgi:hypothetical protein